MFLAEAVSEKDYLKATIERVRSRILWLSTAYSESDSKLNKELIDNKLYELDKLYREYQKYSIIISRAKEVSKLKLNKEEFSIADAENLVEVLENKSDFFESLVNKVEGSHGDPSNVMCLDLKHIDKQMEMVRSDIKTIRNSISTIMWSVEV